MLWNVKNIKICYTAYLTFFTNGHLRGNYSAIMDVEYQQLVNVQL